MDLQIILWGLVAVSLATGLVAGVFLAFSDFVMKSLAASQPAAGTEAMQIINRKVFQTLFMVLLIGCIPVTAAVAGYAYFFMTGPGVNYLIAAGVLYFVGVFGVSMVGNIPMNQRLAAMPDGGGEAQGYWPSYVRGWVLWNHVRTVTAAGSAVCYMIAAVLLAQGV